MNFNLLIILLFFTACSSISHKNEETSHKKEVAFTQDLLSKKTSCLKRVKYYQLLKTQLKTSAPHHFDKGSALDLCHGHLKESLKVLDEHSNKIGLFIQKEKHNSAKSQAITDGIKASLKKLSPKNKIDIIVAKPKLSKVKINQILAKMVFQHRIGVVVAWGEESFVKHIQNWQNKLEIPGLFISNKVKSIHHSFRVFPNRKNYTLELIKNLKEKNVKKIAFLTPDYLKKTPLLNLIKKALPPSGIEITHDIEYSYNEFQTYDLACKALFNIDPLARKEELEMIRAEEALKAQAKGFKLNTKHVFLPAQTTFDAVFIPDDFRTVLQFTKLFKYYQAKDIHLIGTYQWRSEDLLIPKERYLSGATFVDFLGDYRNLPFEVTKNDSSYRTDYKLMGYYTGLLSQKAILESNNSISKAVQRLKTMKLNDGFMKNKPAFEKNQFDWPSFSINVYQNKFHITDYHQ